MCNHFIIPTLPSKNIIATVRSHIVLPTATIKQRVHSMQDIFTSINTQELIKLTISNAISNFPLSGQKQNVPHM